MKITLEQAKYTRNQYFKKGEWVSPTPTKKLGIPYRRYLNHRFEVVYTSTQFVVLLSEDGETELVEYPVSWDNWVKIINPSFVYVFFTNEFENSWSVSCTIDNTHAMNSVKTVQGYHSAARIETSKLVKRSINIMESKGAVK